MDLEDTQKLLARARQREEEIGKENLCSDSLQSVLNSDEEKAASEGVKLLRGKEKSEVESIYPIEQLRKLSQGTPNDVVPEARGEASRTDVIGATADASGKKEMPKRRSMFADLADDFSNFEVDLRQREKPIKAKQASSRLSMGETRPNALFAPNANYYSSLSVTKSLLQQTFEPLKPVSEKKLFKGGNNIDMVPASAEIYAAAKEPTEKKGARQELVPRCYQAGDDLTNLSTGESGEDEKQPTGPFESTAFLNSSANAAESGYQEEVNLKRFFEKQSQNYSSPCPSQNFNGYEPSPIPKLPDKLAAVAREKTSLYLNGTGEKHRDIVDEITAAAKDATKDLADLPQSCGRAKEIAIRLEEKSKFEVTKTPVPVVSSAKTAAFKKASVQPTTDTHIHYPLSVPVRQKTPKPAPAPVIDTTPANVRNLRSRWELSSSSGTPLHPDQGEDDLMEAARKMSCSAKQMDQWRARSQSSYEPTRFVGDSCEKNGLGDHCRALSVQFTSSHEMDEKLPVIVEPAKEEEKCKKRVSTSGEDEDDAAVISGEKKPKREEKDECQLSSGLIGEALDAFEFLNETPTRTSSFLSSVLDVTPEAQAVPSQKIPSDFTAEESGSDEIPLVHSVSFYRKKRKELKSVGETTILGQFTTSPPRCSSNSAEQVLSQSELSEGQKFANEKTRLEQAILVQEEQISQASKAIAHCRQNREFKGSRMEVDAQRALRIATERRKALIYVLDNLLQSYSRGTRVQEPHKPRGTLTIKDISLRLMRDFINGHINYHSDHMLYYFMVLIRHDETVHHTAMVTSDEGLSSGYIAFPNYIQLKSLPHDFTCWLEIYALRTKREMLNQTATSLKKPTKLPSFSQGFSSPGAPTAIIDPSFQKIGKVSITMENITKTKFHLVDAMSPLDGAASMTLTCFPEETGTVGHKGFLSLYQEVEAIASWTRFWCVLNDGNLRFWKYPEDESTKKPVVIINLRDSASETIKPLAAETCPYPHSMTIDIWIESAERKGKREKIRIMMAADTKEDMHRWLMVLNESLRNITLWYPKH